MNLVKAIDIITHCQIQLQDSCDPGLFKAVLLALQAAKRIQQARMLNQCMAVPLLPGETEVVNDEPR